MLNKRIFWVSISIAILSIGLTWISSGNLSLNGWGSFVAVFIIGSGLLTAGWGVLRSESLPDWIGWLTIGATLLRLSVGIVWFFALPEWGHGTEVELAGYVMSDAFNRDKAAWDLAISEKPLISAFQDYRLADQYGGFLFFSSAIYRWFGGNSHKPLMMVVLTASIAGLSIPYLWVFTRRLWGESVAKVASWILFLYPESVLLGSTQMREAFLMTLACMALVGVLVFWQDRKLLWMVWVVGVLLLCIPISSPFALMLLGVVFAMVLILGRARILGSRTLWLIIGCLIVIGIGVVGFLGDRIYPDSVSNPVTLIQEWLRYAAKWETRTAAISSGWLDKVFQRSPDWMNVWIILGYGTVQPFLPAALIAIGNWVWRLIAIWRSIGWTFILFCMLFAPIRAFKNIRKQYIAAGISILVWIVIITSAYRGGGDQWDNPRYRVMFVGLQVALCGWVWVEQRLKPDPWMRRVLVGMGLVFAWFIPWYLRRYSSTFTWPVVDLFKTLNLGLVSAILYWIWDWLRVKEINHQNDPTG
jgi:hypothetical protein